METLSTLLADKPKLVLSHDKSPYLVTLETGCISELFIKLDNLVIYGKGYTSFYF